FDRVGLVAVVAPQRARQDFAVGLVVDGELEVTLTERADEDLHQVRLHGAIVRSAVATRAVGCWLLASGTRGSPAWCTRAPVAGVRVGAPLRSRYWFGARSALRSRYAGCWLLAVGGLHPRPRCEGQGEG